MTQTLHTENQLNTQPILEPGTYLDKFQLSHMLTAGGFGQIYEAKYHNYPTILKIESNNAKIKLLFNESSCLRSLANFYNPTNLPSQEPFLNFYHYGTTQTVKYLAMEKCGQNLRDLKNQQPLNRFSVPTALWIAHKMIESLEKMHNIGWLHRDVKPANFCIGLKNAKLLFVLDFGMSKIYVENDGTLKPRKINSPFHGTLRYVSINIHNRKDASRWDDLWSVFYIMIENMVGFLPWRRLGDVNKVAETKKAADFAKLKYGREERAPLSVVGLLKCLKISLEDESCFYTPPPYSKMLRDVKTDLHHRNLDMSRVKLDWTQNQYPPTYTYNGAVYNMTPKKAVAQKMATPKKSVTKRQPIYGDYGDRSVRFY